MKRDGLPRSTPWAATVSVLVGFLFGCDFGLEGPSLDPNSITAKQRLDDVMTLAKSHKETLALWTVVGEDVTTGGTSGTWRYLFADMSQPGPEYWFHATAFEVAFDSTTPMPEGAARITHRWFDSDSALLLAERNGGSQFRNTYPRCTINASVGEPLVPNATTIWWVSYKSQDDRSGFLTMAIDANTGAVQGHTDP